ncbi:MAG: hypothetical protein VB084_09875 [Syntrophomonadaceae bacterium]|nr:hypothetical protein [Syntrophomonadaceae bacterium]
MEENTPFFPFPLGWFIFWLLDLLYVGVKPIFSAAAGSILPEAVLAKTVRVRNPRKPSLNYIGDKPS